MDQIQTFSKVYAFGDSLTDNSNFSNAATSAIRSFEEMTGFDIPEDSVSSLYFEGRASNGPVWAEILAAELGTNLTPSTELSVLSPEVSPLFNGATTTQSVNFAFSAARTQNFEFLPGIDLIPDLPTQVEWFVNDHQQVEQLADPDALYIVWSGGNDYLRGFGAEPAQVIDDLEESINSLYDLGARNFLIPNIPDLGIIPRVQEPPNLLFDLFTASPSQFTNLTEQHNAALEATLDDLSNNLNDINLIPLDVYSLYNDMLANPEEFGLTNTSDSYLDSPNLGTRNNPDEYLFWDQVHPTAAVHEIFAESALELLNAQDNLFI